MNNTIIGLDIAKNVFHLVVLSRLGNVKQRKKLSRAQVLIFFSNVEQALVALEACGSSHYWAREFKKLGHKVILLPPQHVKGYLRGQKNDFNDARAIAEAAQHGSIRPVSVKTIDQQDKQAFHRVRRTLIKQQTQLCNQMRGMLGEYGVVLAKGVPATRRQIPLILEDAENGLSMRFRELLNRQYNRFIEMDEELNWYEKQFIQEAREDDSVKRLIEIPGFGPINGSAFNTWIGDGKQFKRGRDASSALGIVPKQHSSGGKERLLGISKRGDSYVRSLIIHGARSVVVYAKNKDDQLSLWINNLVEKRGFNKAVVALANKLVRIAWAVVSSNQKYDAGYSANFAKSCGV